MCPGLSPGTVAMFQKRVSCERGLAFLLPDSLGLGAHKCPSHSRRENPDTTSLWKGAGRSRGSTIWDGIVRAVLEHTTCHNIVYTDKPSVNNDSFISPFTICFFFLSFSPLVGTTNTMWNRRARREIPIFPSPHCKRTAFKHPTIKKDFRCRCSSWSTWWFEPMSPGQEPLPPTCRNEISRQSPAVSPQGAWARWGLKAWGTAPGPGLAAVFSEMFQADVVWGNLSMTPGCHTNETGAPEEAGLRCED